jgi:uncharacterized protein YcgI (DUF1989 family)
MLLLKTATLSLPPERELAVAGGAVETFPVAAGQLLTITDVAGGQPAALFAVAVDDPRHFVSPHHTRVFSNSFLLRLGMRVVTNRRRPAMVLGRDSVGTHDLMMPMTEAGDGSTYIGATDRFRDKVRAAFAHSRVDLVRVPDPINLFLDVAVNDDGSLTPRGVGSPPGGAVTFRVVMDLIVGLAAPLPDRSLWTKPAATPLAVLVHNFPPEQRSER